MEDPGDERPRLGIDKSQEKKDPMNGTLKG